MDAWHRLEWQDREGRTPSILLSPHRRPMIVEHSSRLSRLLQLPRLPEADAEVLSLAVVAW